MIAIYEAIEHAQMVNEQYSKYYLFPHTLSTSPISRNFNPAILPSSEGILPPNLFVPLFQKHIMNQYKH